MSAPLEARKELLLWRLRRAIAGLYAVEMEASQFGLHDCAKHLLRADEHLTRACCALHPDQSAHGSEAEKRA